MSGVLTADFLRKSRRYSDDSIETHLNSLLPPRRLFSTPTPTVLEPPHCQEFIRTQLLPTWAARDDLLTYCSGLAEQTVEQTSLPTNAPPPSTSTAGSPMNQKGEVSERLDPYARRKKEVWEKHDELRRVIVQERGVERVIRRGTWENVVRRCQLQDKVQEGWEEEMERWRELQRK